VRRFSSWLIFIVAVECVVGASPQHPATVFPGTPQMPGLSAPVAFPASPDPVAPLRPSAVLPMFVSPLDWERYADARSMELRIKNGPGTNHELKAQLLAMFDGDRRTTEFAGAIHASTSVVDDPRGNTVDLEHAAHLKAIVAQYGWPTIALVGEEASQAACAILAHSADHIWQAQLVPELQQLVATDKIFGFDVAPIVDRLLVLSGKAQEFGTQFEARDGKITILPVQDQQHLDQLRAQYLLPPVSIFRAKLESLYHMSVQGPR
jgi:hypothetical protein